MVQIRGTQNWKVEKTLAYPLNDQCYTQKGQKGRFKNRKRSYRKGTFADPRRRFSSRCPQKDRCASRGRPYYVVRKTKTDYVFFVSYLKSFWSADSVNIISGLIK